MLELHAGDARLAIDPDHGGRIDALSVGDLDLLRTADDDPGSDSFGAFLMAPWAGRTRHGRFSFDGVEHQLPINAPPHAMHGTVRGQAWTVDASGETTARLRCDLGPSWPFDGWVEHDVDLAPDRLSLALTVHTRSPRMPAACGWHPWFRRQLRRGAPATVDIAGAMMYRRDDEHIAVPELVPPRPQPWDDCFTGFSAPPSIRWEGAGTLTVETDGPCVVVFTEPAEAVCMEPQSGPPDVLNHEPPVVTPDGPLRLTTTWRWR